MSLVIKYFKVLLGVISFVLGLIGVFLPILPTTPFLLLSACMFASSSKKLHDLLIGSKLYKKYISDIKDKKELSLLRKIKVLGLMTLLLSCSMYFTPVLIGKVIIGVVLLGHYYYFIFKIKTV